MLDVTLREDDSRVRKDHAPENMAMVRHIILNMLQNAKKNFKDMSIRRLQKKAGWDDSNGGFLMISWYFAGDSSLRSERRHIFDGTTVTYCMTVVKCNPKLLSTMVAGFVTKATERLG